MLLIREPKRAAATLSAGEIKRFRDDGALVLRGRLEPACVETLRAGWADIRQAVTREGSGLTRSDRFIFGTLPAPVGEVFRHPALAAIARQLLGHDVALYMNRILLKDAKCSAPVHPHQDMVYFHGGHRKLAVFVPLAPMNAATGGLRFVLGSHRYGNLGVRGVPQLDQFPPMETLAPEMQPGDVCLMDFLLWHHSGPATEPSDRPILQITYQPADDGSYYQCGVPQPTLVCGRWRTNHFLSLGQGVKPDAA
jgi:hypothetical protein